MQLNKLIAKKSFSQLEVQKFFMQFFTEIKPYILVV